MSITTNRRQLLAAIPAAAVAVSLPAAALATAAPADRRAWDHAMALYVAAKQASDDYDANVFDPAYYREKAFEESHGIFRRDNEGEWMPGYWDLREALRAQYDYGIPDDIGEEQERLCDLMVDARNAVMQVPAPDLAALHWKLDELTDGGTNFGPSWDEDFTAQTLADMARLLPEGR